MCRPQGQTIKEMTCLGQRPEQIVWDHDMHMMMTDNHPGDN